MFILWWLKVSSGCNEITLILWIGFTIAIIFCVCRVKSSMNIIILLLYIYDTPPCCQPESNIYRCNSCCCWLVKRKKPKIIIISEERTTTFMCIKTQIVYSSELIPNLLRISAFLCAVCVVHGMELSCLIIWSDVTCFVIYVSISKIYTNKMQKRRHKKRTKKNCLLLNYTCEASDR